MTPTGNFAHREAMSLLPNALQTGELLLKGELRLPAAGAKLCSHTRIPLSSPSMKWCVANFPCLRICVLLSIENWW